jgi:hypothetical protein
MSLAVIIIPSHPCSVEEAGGFRQSSSKHAVEYGGAKLVNQTDTVFLGQHVIQLNPYRDQNSNRVLNSPFRIPTNVDLANRSRSELPQRPTTKTVATFGHYVGVLRAFEGH